ncbi:alpha/beta fold hydrolase [Pseudonocardia sp. NPDC049635]|uniref:alpha/beta fold hydrolase n=1 Tax=Pseudonocardia sp. NPDC049635 TaxID=3155506 RepID=UPI0033CFF1EA
MTATQHPDLPVLEPTPGWATPITSRRALLDTDFGQMHVRMTGDPDHPAPPLLLVHQTPSSSREWMRAAVRLGPRRCIVPDLMGLGFSDPAPHAMSLSDHATAVLQAVSELTGEWVAIGHHTGAVVATAVAGAQPAATTGLGIIGYPLYDGWRVRYERLSNCTAAHYDEDAVADLWRRTASSYADGVAEDVVLEAVSDKLLAGVVWYGTYVALWTSDLVEVARRAAGRPAVVLAPEGDGLSRFAPRVAELLGARLVPMAGGARILTDDPDAVVGALAPLLGS